MKLTPGKAEVVKAPIIEESPVSIECRVKEIIPLGSHHVFIADVVNVQADDRYLDKDSGSLSWRMLILWYICMVDILNWEKN